MDFRRVRYRSYFYSTPSYNLSGGTPVTVNVSLIYGGTFLHGTGTDANTQAPLFASVQVLTSGGGAGPTTASDRSYANDASRLSEAAAKRVILHQEMVVSA